MSERIFTLEAGGRPLLCFPARNHQEAQSLQKEEWLRADLRTLTSDGKPLWDGSEKLLVRNADTVEMERFQREAATLAHDDGDLPIVYLVQLS